LLQEFGTLSLVKIDTLISTNMNVVISDYWDIYPPEIVSAELISSDTGLPAVEPITLPGNFEVLVHIRDPLGIGYLSLFKSFQ
jgi:hypothetical protein